MAHALSGRDRRRRVGQHVSPARLAGWTLSPVQASRRRAVLVVDADLVTGSNVLTADEHQLLPQVARAGLRHRPCLEPCVWPRRVVSEDGGAERALERAVLTLAINDNVGAGHLQHRVAVPVAAAWQPWSSILAHSLAREQVHAGIEAEPKIARREKAPCVHRAKRTGRQQCRSRACKRRLDLAHAEARGLWPVARAPLEVTLPLLTPKELPHPCCRRAATTAWRCAWQYVRCSAVAVGCHQRDAPSTATLRSSVHTHQLTRLRQLGNLMRRTDA
eukprot:scaffold86399_cov74-Phaeocystis_antarctica.AAC.2